jgi:hypothetical protein
MTKEQHATDRQQRLRRLTALAVTVAAVSSLASCVGEIKGATENQPQRAVQIVAARFPRLSHAQWELTVVDLLHLNAPTDLSASFAPDPLGGRVFDNDQEVLAVGPGLFRDYQRAAERIAESVTNDAALLAGIVPAASPDDARSPAQTFLESFGLRAFRRPLMAAELAPRLALFEQGRGLYPELDPFVAGVRLSIAAFLQSPHFIYRTELTAQVFDDHVEPLNDWEVASRLSYAIWNSMPDAELFRAASAHELSTPAALHAQIERMLATPRARNMLQRFFDQLYDADQYLTLNKNAELYPRFVPEVGGEMRAELDKFGEDIFVRGGGLRELLTSTHDFVTPRLAALYGLDPSALTSPDSDGFSRVDLDPSQRSGLLTRLGFLAWKGKETQPNTIQRGVFIVRRIICQPLGAPPQAALGATLGAQATNRDRVNTLTGPGTCGAGCHATYINPAGFAFEHFGALGEYRKLDGDRAIDSAGSFPFQAGLATFDDAVSFSNVLAQSDQVHACFGGYLLEYLLGRERAAGDADLITQLSQHSLAGASIRELIGSVLESTELRYPITTLEVL